MGTTPDLGGQPIQNVGAPSNATDADTKGARDTAIATHSADTTAVHGITDTSTLVLTNDSRLSDVRTPTDASVTAAKVAAALKPSGSAAAGTEALRALGTSASTATAGNDSRLSDTRTPTDATVTYTKTATGTTGLAVGAFSVTRHGALNIAASNVVTLIPFETEDFDISGWLDTTVNIGRYTPQVAGYYRLSAILLASGIVGSKTFAAYLYKNGSIFKYGATAQTANTGLIGSTVTATVVANGTTDYFEIYGQQSDSSAHPLTADVSHFDGEFIGRS